MKFNISLLWSVSIIESRLPVTHNELSFTKGVDTMIDLGDYNNIENLARISQIVYNNHMEDSLDISDPNRTIKAYLFSNSDMTVNVIGIKGTTVDLSEVGRNDKRADNIIFSCCYKKAHALDSCNTTWYQDSCNTTWYQDYVTQEDSYYNVMSNIVEMLRKSIDFDKSFVMFTGHSLGGALATLMGVKYNKPVVTFETPGERNFLEKSGLISDVYERHDIYHYGHNADIIFTGKCNGLASLCRLAGYIIETTCHVGYVCEYDSKHVLGIPETLYTHKISYVIDNIITRWNKTLPKCEMRTCEECHLESSDMEKNRKNVFSKLIRNP
jgi:lipase ATG15